MKIVSINSKYRVNSIPEKLIKYPAIKPPKTVDTLIEIPLNAETRAA